MCKQWKFYFFSNLFSSFFSPLIAVARTSKTEVIATGLNKSGESRYPFIVSDLRWNTFSFLPLIMMLDMSFSYRYELYYIDIISFYSKFVESFSHEKRLNFVICFFCIFWADYVIFIFCPLKVLYGIDWFVYVEPFVH